MLVSGLCLVKQGSMDRAFVRHAGSATLRSASPNLHYRPYRVSPFCNNSGSIRSSKRRRSNPEAKGIGEALPSASFFPNEDGNCQKHGALRLGTDPADGLVQRRTICHPSAVLVGGPRLRAPTTTAEYGSKNQIADALGLRTSPPTEDPLSRSGILHRFYAC